MLLIKPVAHVSEGFEILKELESMSNQLCSECGAMSTTRTDRIGKTSNLLVIQRSIATKSGDKKGKWLQVEQELHINNEPYTLVSVIAHIETRIS